MSGQTIAGPGDDYYLSSRGVEKVIFNEDIAPPLAPLDKHLLYVLASDDKLYYDGQEVAVTSPGSSLVSGPPVTTLNAVPRWGDATGDTIKNSGIIVSDTNNVTGINSETFVPVAANPGGAATLWVNSGDSNIYFGATNLETGGGNVSSAIVSSANEIATYTNTTGQVIGKSNITASVNTTLNTMLIRKLAVPTLGGTALDNVFVGCNAGGTTNPQNNQSNTLIGSFAGESIASNDNTIVGANALRFNSNVVGSNVSIGSQTMRNATSVQTTVSIGAQAGQNSTTSGNDVFVGHRAGYSAGGSSSNVLIGLQAGGAALGTPVTGFNQNVMIGSQAGSAVALANNVQRNVLIGNAAGTNISTNLDCIYLGASVTGTAGENGVIRIGTDGPQVKAFMAGIRGVMTVNADAIPVLIDSVGQLGTTSSSIKYKEKVEDLKNSEIIYKLRPVEFNYIGQDKRSIGLIAEEVEKEYPEMCIYQDGELLTVDYSKLSILLLGQIKNLNERVNMLENVFRNLMSK